MSELTIRSAIEIHAGANEVWKVLTRSEFTKQYMHGCEVVSDWSVGSPLLWRGSHEGSEVVFVKGHIVKNEPDRELHYTTYGPQEGLADIPSNYMTVTYVLTPTDRGVRLAVSQGDFSKRSDGKGAEHFEGGEAGWHAILEQIKALAEKHDLNKAAT